MCKLCKNRLIYSEKRGSSVGSMSHFHRIGTVREHTAHVCATHIIVIWVYYPERNTQWLHAKFGFDAETSKNIDEGIYESKCQTPTRQISWRTHKCLRRNTQSENCTIRSKCKNEETHLVWSDFVTVTVPMPKIRRFELFNCIMLVETGIWKRVFIVIVIHLIIFCFVCVRLHGE